MKYIKYIIILEWILTIIVLGCAITLLALQGPTFIAGVLAANSTWMLIMSILLAITSR